MQNLLNVKIILKATWKIIGTLRGCPPKSGPFVFPAEIKCPC